MFIIGDKVRTRGDNHRGTVVGFNYDSITGITEYTVEFDDKNLIPPRMDYPYWALDKHSPHVYKCECGLASTREGGRHSDWCPMYVKEEA